MKENQQLNARQNISGVGSGLFRSRNILGPDSAMEYSGGFRSMAISMLTACDSDLRLAEWPQSPRSGDVYSLHVHSPKFLWTERALPHPSIEIFWTT